MAAHIFETERETHEPEVVATAASKAGTPRYFRDGVPWAHTNYGRGKPLAELRRVEFEATRTPGRCLFDVRRSRRSPGNRRSRRSQSGSTG